ncbi:YwhD family protein [Pueribacillus theae]|nr:YwhD family protein [Pueribacillus theae]
MKDIFSNDNSQFNIVSGDSTDGHGGFGVGTFTLNNMTPVFVDIEAGEAFIDVGAMHARSRVEKRVKFLPDKDAVPDAKPYWLVWVTVERKEEGPYYAGVTACEMTVNKELKRGYKNFPDHVNKMDKSRKGQIIVEHMDDKSKTILKNFLEDFDSEMWQRSSKELKDGLTV